MKTTGIVLILLVATLALPLGSSFASPANPPTNLVAQSVSSTQINLSWNAPINATQSNVSGYRIEQDQSCDGSFVILANTTSTTYSNIGLNAGTCYAYRVFALNPDGPSVPSNIDFDVTFAVPSAPSLTVTASSATSLKLAWTAPANNGANITGYQIQRNGTVLVSNTGNTKLVYLDTSLKPLSTQTYRVAAWNSVGLGAFSANITAKTLNQTGTVDKGNLGQAVSDFVHKRNELLKKQREETLRLIQQCHDKAVNATGTTRKQIMEDCREMMKTLKDKYNDARKQFREEFKTFRENTKSIIKEAKKTGNIDKIDIKEIKRELKDFENDTRKEHKEVKREIKDLRKDLKKELKEHKKEQKKNKDED
ncbi:MAG: fibronectin type III domain-containing protein [Candidatus Nitrosotenuis sp.]|jgi:hypothetical protein